ncbi:hypothetical protein I4I73_27405 [Pseudonocardia sp. KRD-184]|uniref:Uncharacterized protein n=1 Tax=Pseudonocardia oceani TaxID=2792013 RepID=A0ABS6UGN3_9PSEU|nr:hypothetical protein [Pseudonocardia oceani]MBW0092959.1 hypothetical protein [Pseudonocardia oceani]MBW0099720.1 hypothetical protein [Pseudonocardia oceani]MBW0113487.1 hypothetical protein [Pseudonocardia oceani]MBW0120353.1 hypothetical protein [Pseudonocardia oceani]MBW0131393.1 hypothetical protein [Pseudonocardia oceani]
MPLDWTLVMDRYDGGTRIPTVAGGKTLEITGVDDTGVHIRHALWRDTLAREHLSKAAELIESDRMSRHAGLFVEEYRALVADVRATSVAHVLKDLGYLE